MVRTVWRVCVARNVAENRLTRSRTGARFPASEPTPWVAGAAVGVAPEVTFRSLATPPSAGATRALAYRRFCAAEDREMKS